jgi:hypothetical protein
MQLQVAAEKEGNLYKLTTLKEGIASMSTLWYHMFLLISTLYGLQEEANTTTLPPAPHKILSPVKINIQYINK